jgi:hypothetical protein
MAQAGKPVACKGLTPKAEKVIGKWRLNTAWQNLLKLFKKCGHQQLLMAATNNEPRSKPHRSNDIIVNRQRLPTNCPIGVSHAAGLYGQQAPHSAMGSASEACHNKVDLNAKHLI